MPELQKPDPDFPNIMPPDPANPVISQQPVRVGDHEQLLAKQAGIDYAEPDVTKPMGTAQDHKQFLADENIRTEEQADREEANRPKEREQTPGGSTDVDHAKTTPTAKPKTGKR